MRQLLVSPVYFGGKDEVALCKAVYLVRPDLHSDLPVGNVEVRVVAFRLGNLGDGVDKAHRLHEALEGVALDQLLAILDLPAVELVQKRLDLLGPERWDASSTWDALLVR